MTEHRPECRWPQYAKALLWGSVSRASRERVSCICKELLACEARVTAAAVQRVEALICTDCRQHLTVGDVLGTCLSCDGAWEALAAIKNEVK
jgi:hypothetical protein